MRLPIRAFEIHAGEAGRILLFFCYSFFVIATIVAGKSARDAYFLTRYDKSLLPLMFAAIAVSVAAFLAIDTSVLRRIGVRGRLLLLHGLFAASLVTMYGHITGWVVAFFYVWIEIINVLLTLEFWALASQVFDSRQAKRLLGLISGGGSLAAVGMGFSIGPFVLRFGTAAMALLVAGLIVSAGALALVATKRIGPHARERPREQQAGPSRRWGPYLTAIAAVVVLAAAMSTIVDYQFKILASEAHPMESDLMGFLGQFYAVTGIASFVIQVFGTAWIIRRFGVVGGLVSVPLAVGLPSLGILFSPGLWSGVIAKCSDQASRFTSNVALEVLWMPVAPERRKALKPFITGTLRSLSEGFAGLAVFVLIKFLALRYLSIFVVAAAIYWIVTSFRLRSLYSETLTTAIEEHHISTEELSVAVQDPAMRSIIERTLEEGDQAQRLFALELIGEQPLTPWRQHLQRQLRDGGPEIRKRVLDLAAGEPGVLPDDLLLRAAQGEDEFAADAMVVAGRQRVAGGVPLFERRMRGAAPHLRAAASVAMLRLEQGPVDEARQTLKSMLETDSAVEQAAALRRLDGDFEVLHHQRLVTLLSSPSPAVREAALGVAAQRPHAEFLPGIVAAAAASQSGAQGRSALKSFPAPQVVAECRRVLSDSDTSAGSRLGVIRTLRDYPSEPSVEALVSCIDGSELHVIEEIADSSRAIAHQDPLPETARQRFRQECDSLVYEAYRATRLLVLVSTQPDGGLLEDYYRNRFQDVVTALLKLRTVEIPSFPLETCIEAVRKRDTRRLPFVLELFETALETAERAQVLPLIEPLSPSRRDLHGREHYPDLPDTLEPVLEENVYSTDEWYSVISLRHLFLNGQERSLAALQWERVPVSQAHRELITSVLRDGRTTLPETARARFVGEGAKLPMYSILEKTVLLRSVGLFRDVPAATLSRIAPITGELSVPAGTRLFNSGEHGDSLYVVVRGKVRIHKGNLDIAVLGKGECLGEMALLDQEPRSADATVLEDATLFRIYQEDFFELMTAHVEIMRSVMRLLTARLREANRKLDAAAY